MAIYKQFKLDDIYIKNSTRQDSYKGKKSRLTIANPDSRAEVRELAFNLARDRWSCRQEIADIV